MDNSIPIQPKAFELITILLIYIVSSLLILLKVKVLIIAITIFLFLFLISICLVNPKFGLLLALCSMFNPYYVFLSNVQIWSNASLRVSISLFLGILLFLDALLKMRFKRLSIGNLEIRLFLFLLILIFGTWYGFIVGNTIRAILADLFPFLEFIGYYFLTVAIFKDSTEIEIKNFLKYLLIWCNLVVVTELFTYIIFNQQFAYQVYISGIEVKRIMDFMLIFILSSLLVITKYKLFKDYKFRIYTNISLIICVIAIFLTFTRSIWLGAFIEFLFIMYMLKKQNKQRTKSSYKLIKITGLILILLFVNYIFDIHILNSVIKLTISRLTQQSLYSPMGVSFDFFRIIHLESQIKEIITHPILGKGLGGTFWALYGDIGALKEGWTSQVFNIYIRVLFKLGSIGFFIFIIVVYEIWREAKKYFYNTNIVTGKVVSCIIMGTMVGYGVTFLFFTPILHFPIMVYLGFLLGILKNLSQYEKSNIYYVYA